TALPAPCAAIGVRHRHYSLRLSVACLLVPITAAMASMPAIPLAPLATMRRWRQRAAVLLAEGATLVAPATNVAPVGGPGIPRPTHHDGASPVIFHRRGSS